MVSYDELSKPYLDDKLTELFVLNSLDLFFKSFHKFIFEIRETFMDN